jgi:hypothetical protein
MGWRRTRPSLACALAAALTAIVALPTAGHGAGRRPYGGTLRVTLDSLEGLDDPRLLSRPASRWLATWTHCRLFRVDGGGRVRSELARDPGEMRGRTLTIRLVDGARFHDDQPITSADVLQSLQALAAAPTTPAPLAELVRLLELRAPDPLTLEVRAPARTDPNTLRRLLARPEAAVLRGGAPGRGRACGPFKPQSAGPGAVTLLAHTGHPEGRPWLDRVDVKVLADPRAQSAAFADQDTDLSAEAALRDRRDTQSVVAAQVTLFAVVAPSLRGDAARVLRQNFAALAREARLVRHSDWPAQTPSSLWPALLSPTSAPLGTTGPALPQPGLVIAYPDGDSALADVARGLRDALARLSLTPARAVAVAGLDLRGAITQKSPPWSLAVVAHTWQALDPEQAALELARALDRPGLKASEALTGRAGAFAAAQNDALPVIPLLHLERPVHFRAWLGLDGGSGARVGPPVIDLGDAWRRR